MAQKSIFAALILDTGKFIEMEEKEILIIDCFWRHVMRIILFGGVASVNNRIGISGNG